VSRKSVIILATVYFLAALTFGVVAEVTQPFSSLDWKDPAFLGSVFGLVAYLYVGSAIIPLIVWAFGRFRAQRAVIPFVIWAVLGIALMTLIQIGRYDSQQVELARLATIGLKGSDREDFVRGAKSSCIAKLEQNWPNRAGNDGRQQFEKFCGCYSEAMANSMTPTDLGSAMATGTVPAGVQGKSEQAVVSCLAFAPGQ